MYVEANLRKEIRIKVASKIGTLVGSEITVGLGIPVGLGVAADLAAAAACFTFFLTFLPIFCNASQAGSNVQVEMVKCPNKCFVSCCMDDMLVF